MAHRRNMATEDELDARARQQPVRSADDCAARLRTHIGRFDGLFPLDPDLRYLDIGCGNGELTVALAMTGCKNATGVDFVPRKHRCGYILSESAGRWRRCSLHRRGHQQLGSA